MFLSYIHYLELMQKYTSLQGDYMATHKLYVSRTLKAGIGHSGRSTLFDERERASATEDVQMSFSVFVFLRLHEL